MVDALYIHAGPFALLEEMVEDMAGSLSLIAYCGLHEDKQFVCECVNSFYEAYSNWFEKVGDYETSPGLSLITQAYDIFVRLDEEQDPDYVKELALEARGYLFGESSEDFLAHWRGML